MIKEKLQHHIQQRLEQLTGGLRNTRQMETKTRLKRALIAKRGGEFVKVKAKSSITGVKNEKHTDIVSYRVHLQYVIKQKDHFYLEEEAEERIASFYKGKFFEDKETAGELSSDTEASPSLSAVSLEETERALFTYDRLKAVQYAERWWNDHNPAYKSFSVNCTNYVSQCIRAGGAPMTGYPHQGKGWWMQNNSWSYSWTVANAFRHYLPNAKKGLRAKIVQHPEELIIGDVICYDFQGNGRFDHTTIVTEKDASGMPLVNANTTNSRMRYWSYEDSTAYTENIQYVFLSILDSKLDSIK
ncbi:amidase domain-containing protein [Bacillaceae bacterium Marseille-Q3522]|nr:amidase domain-containing protein [Bacillaceae bacterium Marseille-Q3522]